MYARPGAHNPKRDRARRDMTVGGAVCAVGILITVASYMAAADGGMYVVTWGAIIFGGFQFLRGLGEMTRL